MTFRWKDKAKLFSGEGIYFLTFVVVNDNIGDLVPPVAVFWYR